MSLMRSLSAGISGLQGFQTKMDVIGNNIANSNTAGFKSSRVTFAELFAQNDTKPGARFSSAPSMVNQVGLGSRVSSISRVFSDGPSQSTGIKTDLSLDGSGFFVVNNGEESTLTRAGNFKFNSAGNLVTESGFNVQGYNANANGEIVAGGAAESIQISFDDTFAPKRTENVYLAGNFSSNTSVKQVLSMTSALTNEATGNEAVGTDDINSLTQTTTDFNVGDIIDISGTAQDGTAISTQFTYTGAAGGQTLNDLVATINGAAGITGQATAQIENGKIVLRSNDPNDAQISLQINSNAGNAAGVINFSTLANTVEGSVNSKTISNTVYDEQGNAHTLLLEFTQNDIDANAWSINASFLNGESISAGGSQNITFDGEGNLLTPSDGEFDITFDPGNGSGAMTFKVDLSDPTVGKVSQYDGTSTANFVKQDGFAKGELTDYFIDADGLIVGTYSNGKSKSLAQLAVATVANNNALEHIGSGLFRSNPQAGDVVVTNAGNLENTNINSGFLEGSNVDLAQEFTEMIVAQRAYQSNARVITTTDQLLQEVVQLKR